MIDSVSGTNMVGLWPLRERLLKLGLEPHQLSYFFMERGACSVFSTKWLSEVLGVMSGHSIRAPQQRAEAVRQAIYRNAALQLRVGEGRLMTVLMNVHGLQLVGEPFKLRNLSAIAPYLGSYFIACAGTSSHSQHADHAIAYTTLHDGKFFDPNAGEYEFTTGTQRDQKIQFFMEWQRINTYDAVLYHYYNCYRVERLP